MNGRSYAASTTTLIGHAIAGGSLNGATGGAASMSPDAPNCDPWQNPSQVRSAVFQLNGQPKCGHDGDSERRTRPPMKDAPTWAFRVNVEATPRMPPTREEFTSDSHGLSRPVR